MTTKQELRQAIRLHAKDNVATAIAGLPAGAGVRVQEEAVAVAIKQDIDFGHKFALSDIRQGEKVYKYGVPIGMAMKDIARGEHVHLHNLRSLQTTGGESGAGLSAGEWKNRHT